MVGRPARAGACELLERIGGQRRRRRPGGCRGESGWGPGAGVEGSVASGLAEYGGGKGGGRGSSELGPGARRGARRARDGEGPKPRMGAEGQRNCGERGGGGGGGRGGAGGAVSGLPLAARPGREVMLGVCARPCVFRVGDRGAPGLVLEEKRPEGGEQVSVVIPEPGGGPAGRAGGRAAGVEGPGQWSAAGAELRAPGACEGRGRAVAGARPGRERYGGVGRPESRVDWRAGRGRGAGPRVGGEGSAIARPGRAPRPGSAPRGGRGSRGGSGPAGGLAGGAGPPRGGWAEGETSGVQRQRFPDSSFLALTQLLLISQIHLRL